MMVQRGSPLRLAQPHHSALLWVIEAACAARLAKSPHTSGFPPEPNLWNCKGRQSAMSTPSPEVFETFDTENTFPRFDASTLQIVNAGA